MPRLIEGTLNADGKRFGIVVGRFNAFIGKELLGGAMDCLKRHGADTDGVDVVWVPGSFEMPLVARKLAASGNYDAIVCLGAVIRGATPHWEYVANEAAKGNRRGLAGDGRSRDVRRAHDGNSRAGH